jgi:acylphosphatase
VPFSLKPGEHQQINGFIAANGVPNLEDGRIEIVIDSETGAVTAYASVLDNQTTDPLAVMPVSVDRVSANRFIIPGIAELNNGAANFHSDVRIFNGGNVPLTANLTFYPQRNPGGAKTSAPLQIAAGEVRALDNVLPSLFNESGTGGSLVVTTSAPSSLVTTARTYSIGANNGTFGQFIPGVTPAEGIGVGQRALQVLQLEQSQNFRSNLGLVELTGQPARVRITLNVPESRVSPVLELDLAGNEFNQLGSVIASMIPGKNVYNARIAVEVISGSGRVSAYGSVIDNATQDPTYVPAQ